MSDISIKDSISSLFGFSNSNFVEKGKSVQNEDEKKVFKLSKDEVAESTEQTSNLGDEEKVSSKNLSERSKEKVEEEKELSKALQERNEELAQERMYALNQQNIGLSFSFDEDSDNTLVKVTDMNTKQLVRQIPSEEFLEFSEKLNEMIERNQTSSIKIDKEEIKGLLLDDQA